MAKHYTSMQMKQQPQIRTSYSNKLIITLSVVGVFALTVGLTFLFSLLQLPASDKEQKNLVKNPSFEQWQPSGLPGWQNDDAFVFKETTSLIDGQYAVGVYSKDSTKSGIVQTIDTDPEEVYNIYYNLRSKSASADTNIGVKIQFNGTNVSASSDVTEGLHYYDGNNSWRQYFGRVTGASSVTLYFFSKNHTILLIDGVGVGINQKPPQKQRDTLFHTYRGYHTR